MNNIADNLGSVGSVITDDELILYILGGLGKEYESVVVNLTIRSNKISLQEVQFALQSQEMRIEAHQSVFNADPLNAPMANAAYRRGGYHNTSNSQQQYNNGASSGAINKLSQFLHSPSVVH